MVELVLRLVFSLAVVLGLLMLLVRLSAKRFRGSAEALVHVVHRQAISRTSSVAVVSVGSRLLVLGTTEQQVNLLTELDPEELDPDDAQLIDLAAVPRPAYDTDVRGPAATAVATTAPALPAPRHRAEGALAGSVLSAQTWRQAFAAASRRQQDAS